MNNLTWRRRAHDLLTQVQSLIDPAQRCSVPAYDRNRLTLEMQALLAAGDRDLEGFFQAPCGCAWSADYHGRPKERLLACNPDLSGKGCRMGVEVLNALCGG